MIVGRDGGMAAEELSKGQRVDKVLGQFVVLIFSTLQF
jgi:hypothetical protein